MLLCVPFSHILCKCKVFWKIIYFGRTRYRRLIPFYKLGKCSLSANPDPQAQSQTTRVEAEIRLPAHSRGQVPWHSAQTEQPLELRLGRPLWNIEIQLVRKLFHWKGRSRDLSVSMLGKILKFSLDVHLECAQDAPAFSYIPLGKEYSYFSI